MTSGEMENKQILAKRKAKDARLRARYNGFTLEQFEAVLEYQGGVCAICKEPNKVFCFDHNHKTLKFRGIVCLNCNLRVLGGARDKDHLIINAAEYVINNPADAVFPDGFYLIKNPPKTRRKRVSRRRRVN